MLYTVLKRFIPLAFLATVLSGLAFLAVQQSLRQGANDPQIQMAEDAASILQGGTPVKTVLASGTVNINESLAPYIIVYDAAGSPIAGDGLLGGALPNLPVGLFNDTATHGEDRLTWQPQPGIRQAIVLTKIPDGGFVMAGRSLREVEIRESQAQFETAAAWLFALAGLLVLEIIIAQIESHNSLRQSHKS